MIIKIYNAFLKISISVLLVLSLWLVVNGALKESKGNFEFGSLMDFFNTVGTLGTLFVAYRAFKSAPNWFNQRIDDAAFDIANELITHDLPAFKHHLASLLIPFNWYSSSEKYFMSSDLDQLKKTLEETENDISNLSTLVSKAKEKLNKLNRLGWELNAFSKEQFDKLYDQFESFYSVYTMNSLSARLWLTPKDNDIEGMDFIKSNLNKRRELLMEVSETLENNINEIISLHKRFDQYFTRNHN